MAPLTLEQKLTQLQLLSAPETLAAWEARHPAEREAVPRRARGARRPRARPADGAAGGRPDRRRRSSSGSRPWTRFNFEYNAATRKLRSRYLNLLATDLVAEGIGALFVGGSGLGKTHLARALGYAQCQRGHRVLFTTLAALVNRLSAAEATKSLHRALKVYQSPLVLCVDEIGYATLRQPESHLLFQVLSVRHDRKRPTMITTNRVFGEWNQIFADDAVAHAILDRLAERAEVFHLEGTSYRETHRRPAPKVPPA